MMTKRAFIAVLRAIKSPQPACLDSFKDGSWYVIRCWQRFGEGRRAEVVDLSRHRDILVAHQVRMRYARWLDDFKEGRVL